MYCTHTNDEFIEYAALTIQAHTNDQPNCRRYAVSDRSILLEVETDLTGAHLPSAHMHWDSISDLAKKDLTLRAAAGSNPKHAEIRL